MEELTSLAMDAAPLLDEPEDETDKDWGTKSSSAGRNKWMVSLAFLAFGILASGVRGRRDHADPDSYGSLI